MFLANDSQYMQPSVEIPHEIMHAQGLKHTFDKAGKHIFKLGKTTNYMDYNNNKKMTMLWQWQLVQNWINSNTKFTK